MTTPMKTSQALYELSDHMKTVADMMDETTLGNPVDTGLLQGHCVELRGAANIANDWANAIKETK
jgi:hypothetical protein